MASMPVAAVTWRGEAQCQFGVEQRVPGDQRQAADAALLPVGQGDHRHRRGFGAGAGGGGDEDQRQAGARGLADAPDRVDVVARTDEVGGELGDIHRAAAAEADHGGAARPASAAASRVASDGSASTRSKTTTSRSRPSAASGASVRPAARTPASVTKSSGPGGSSAGSAAVAPRPAMTRGP
jgi:hypothetical protein